MLIYAGMMKLVNMLDLGSSAARLVGSSPTTRTRWTRVGVLNSFLRLSNTLTLVLWEEALIFQAFSCTAQLSILQR